MTKEELRNAAAKIYGMNPLDVYIEDIGDQGVSFNLHGRTIVWQSWERLGLGWMNVS